MVGFSIVCANNATDDHGGDAGNIDRRFLCPWIFPEGDRRHNFAPSIG